MGAHSHARLPHGFQVLCTTASGRSISLGRLKSSSLQRRLHRPPMRNWPAASALRTSRRLCRSCGGEERAPCRGLTHLHAAAAGPLFDPSHRLPRGAARQLTCAATARERARGRVRAVSAHSPTRTHVPRSAAKYLVAWAKLMSKSAEASGGRACRGAAVPEIRSSEQVEPLDKP